MSFEDFKEKLSCFWAENLTKNYKKVSIAIGTTLNMVVSSIVGYFVTCIDPAFVGILYALQALANILIYSFFGKSEERDKAIIDLIAEDENLQKYITSRLMLKELDKKKKMLKTSNGGVLPNDYGNLIKLEKKINKDNILDSLRGLEIGKTDKI